MIRLFTILLITCTLTACEAVMPAAQGGGEVNLAPAVRAPEEVFEAFMAAWNAADYEAMYELVSAPSQELYPLTTFSNRYSTVSDAINLETVNYTFEDMRLQGDSAEVHYDAALESPIFGTIEDPDRIMRLVRLESNQWRVAWTPMDIINGLANDVSFTVQQRLPQRANIYDRDGDVLVEENGTVTALFIRQQDIANIDDCLNVLSEALLVRRSELASLFNQYNADTVFHVGEIDPEIFANWRETLSEQCAINDQGEFRKITQYQNRRYFGHGAATHVTGYVGRIPADDVALWRSRGYAESDLIGRAAIEAAFEEELAGKPERYLRMIEPGGATLRELGGAVGSDSVPVQLTIDRELQYQTTKAINDAFNYAAPNWASVARGAGAVVIDVNTGEILALASYPTFDPTLFNPVSSYENVTARLNAIGNDPLRPLANKAVQEQYSPGSVYKILTTIAASQEDIFPEDELFDCQLEWNGAEYGDTVSVRQDWRVIDDLDPAGLITMPQALTTSCNPFFWTMGGMMYQRDPNMLVHYSEEFGLGSRTGIDVLGSEASGALPVPNSPAAAINNAIGQGDIQVTVLQFARAVAAVANGGKVYQPYIVKQVGGLDGAPVIETFEPELVNEVELDDTTWQTVWQGMCDVPIDEELGTGRYAFVLNQPYEYTTCGKTGTAEAGPRGSGIPPIAWYVAYAPAENPEIAVAVVVPQSREGSEVSAPIVRRILDHYFNQPIAPFPDWWTGEYIPLERPAGVVE